MAIEGFRSWYSGVDLQVFRYVCRRFEGTCCLLFKFEAASSYEMLVHLHQSVRRPIPERGIYNIAICYVYFGGGLVYFVTLRTVEQVIEGKIEGRVEVTCR